MIRTDVADVRFALLVVAASCGRLDFERTLTRDAAEIDAPTLADGLVAYYSMETTTGTTLVDDSGHHRDGACAMGSCGAPTAGVVGSGFQFAGTSAFLVPDAAALDPASGLTVAMWIVNPNPATPLAKVQAADSGGSYELALFATDTWFCTDHDATPGAGGEDCDHVGMALPAQWTHVALTWDGAAKRTYFDGTLVHLDAGPFAIAYDGSPLVIGSDDENGTIKGQFSGKLDEIRIYDRALGPGEITMLATP